MQLAAIYNVWGDFKLLEASIKNIKPLVDVVIVVFSEYSNFGEFEEFKWKELDREPFFNVIFWKEEPCTHHSARSNETDKRNFGLDLARKEGCTHFLSMDADEFYEPEPFLKAKEMFHVKPELRGLVCNCQTYFGSPQLTIGLDTTLVPFIHKLTPNIRHEFNRNYPFAWEGKAIRIDPTRSLNISAGVEKIDLVMHHYSWIREDYEKKIRNSTARTNLERSCILKDLKRSLQQGEGYFCEYYGKPLVRATVDFGIRIP